MATAIHVPRVNNNDDEVKLVAFQVGKSDRVSKGQIVAMVETDKAVVDVEAPDDGFVLALLGEPDNTVAVGSVLMWLGATIDATVPDQASAPAAASPTSSAPTAKAAALLAKHGLDAGVIPASGERLTVADVEQYLAANPGGPKASGPSTHAPEQAPQPDVAGTLRALKSEEKGMLNTVLWHRDTAVPGYVEIEYDPRPWDDCAQAFGRQNGLLLSPLLPLMAWRLVELAGHDRRLNATIVGSKRYEYNEVNLGFTVQAADVLYLAVVRNALALGDLGFVNSLVDLQRRAAAHKLGPLDTQGATIGFSSMARWKVARHMPILPPHTALMIAHASAVADTGVLGATYDHRVLSGADVVGMLRKLAKPVVAN
jgi:pyruvate dehydrogenase E2 component (dihydrolipoamide acetyltransferase)